MKEFFKAAGVVVVGCIAGAACGFISQIVTMGFYVSSAILLTMAGVTVTVLGAKILAVTLSMLVFGGLFYLTLTKIIYPLVDRVFPDANISLKGKVNENVLRQPVG